jgi:hypothetical protein
MEVHELLADFQTQPREERRARVRAVPGELAAHRQVSILDHVGGIDAARQPPVQAQPAPVAFDQDSQGTLVAVVAGGVQQFLIRSGVGAQGSPHSLPGERRPNIHRPGKDCILAAEDFQEPARWVAHQGTRPFGAAARA